MTGTTCNGARTKSAINNKGARVSGAVPRFTEAPSRGTCRTVRRQSLAPQYKFYLTHFFIKNLILCDFIQTLYNCTPLTLYSHSYVIPLGPDYVASLWAFRQSSFFPVQVSLTIQALHNKLTELKLYMYS